jgi:murein DD-endopeptidase / murein LD-carboxypeptidase
MYIIKRRKISTVLKLTRLILLIVLFSGFKNDRFQKIIDQAQTQKLKQKLILFQKGGIERKLICEGYDVEKVIAYAKSLMGAPHKMGGTGLKGLDCSGLIVNVHAKFGIQLPHSSNEQARYGTLIPDKNQLQDGDLVFFYNSYTTKNLITHVGIYLNDGTFIHTSYKYILQ